MRLVLALLLAATACKDKPRPYVDVPGWSCTWDDGECSCEPQTDASVGTHPGCTLPEHTRCVASYGMRGGHRGCVCRTSSGSSGKLGDGDEIVPQCPPPPRQSAQ